MSQVLDDEIVMTQSMSFSPFKGTFAGRIDEWEKTLTLISDVIEEWIRVQRAWMYLEPIFSSDDIMRQASLIRIPSPDESQPLCT
jgi:dynein heavy chain